MKKKNQFKNQNNQKDISETLRNQGNGKIKSDVQGSYTGLSNKKEEPVQDADDL